MGNPTIYLIVVSFFLFPAIGLVIRRVKNAAARDAALATVSLVFGLLVCAWINNVNTLRINKIASAVGPSFLLYIGLVVLSFCSLNFANRSRTAGRLFPVLLPIFFLVAVRVLSACLPATSRVGKVFDTYTALFLGFSYLSFRLSGLAQEVNNGIVTAPRLSRYLAFAFFPPTLVLGPISPYSSFTRTWDGQPDEPIQFLHFVRILLGLVKYLFVSTILNQLTYQGLMLDGQSHTYGQLVVSILIYPLFLYFNFSGFCDMAIGAAGLMGITIMENFKAPFLAPNLQEFWTVWHISLSSWFRDMVFTPMAMSLSRRFGPTSTRNSTAAAIAVSFVLIGIWHGFTLNFLLFGISQAVGVITVFLWNQHLRKKLGAKQFNVLKANLLRINLGRAATYLYFSASLVLFANSHDQLRDMFHAIR